MAVDRVRRDAAADALASFLQGEADRDTLDTVFTRLQQTGTSQEGESDEDTYLEEFLALWFYRSQADRPITEEFWLAMCRHLAYLKTDLEESRLPDYRHEDEDRPRQILLARWHTLGLLVAFGVAFLTSWWLFAVAVVISFVLYQISLHKHDMLKDAVQREEWKPRREYYPFADQAEWLTHKPLVDEYHLPDYDPGVFAAPQPVKKWPAIVTAPVLWICYIFIAAMFLYLYLFSVAFWPVWLVMMSLCRRNIHQQPQPTS